MNIYFDPLNPVCKNITGGIYRGEELILNLLLLNDSSENQSETANYFPKQKSISAETCERPDSEAFLLLKKDGKPETSYKMLPIDSGWQIRLKIHDTGLYFYRFVVKNQLLIFGNDHMASFSDFPNENSRFQLTVSLETYHTPDWFKGGVLYQIFPDRFCKTGTMPDIDGRVRRSDWGGMPSYRPDSNGKVLNNDFFGGTLKGIQSKLPYLSNLHVTAIYLNPIFQAASNHRYDTSDYLKIDPYLGTEKDLAELTGEAEKYGIRVILDGVFNHTGDNSVYFNKYGKFPSVGAYQSKDSPYYSWYTFQEFPDKYSSWWGIDILPELNEESESYQDFILGKGGVLCHWLAYGIGGYRLDVADELPDFFLKKLRKTVKKASPDAIIIGEVWEDASNKIAYSTRREYLQGEELDSVMNYPLKDAIIHFIKTENARNLSETVRTLQDHYPKETLDCLMNILGTHDTARILTVLGGKSCYTKDEMADPGMLLNETEKHTAIEKLKTAALLQYTLPGIPCIYYGDENGAEGYIDPFCRKCFDWEHPNMELISYYEKLGELRKEYRELFSAGVFQEIYVRNGCFIFKRIYSEKEQTAYILANNSSEAYIIRLNGIYREYFENQIYTDLAEIRPYSCKIFLSDQNLKNTHSLQENDAVS